MATYREWIKRISDLPSKKIPSLDEMKRGLEFVGHPEKAFESIHVAGTNGKGSVCTKVAKALSLEGYRVGLYISPHISSYRERISINGLMISEEEVVKYLERIFQIPIEFSFFEISTLLAFMYFADQLVEFAVLETGLGGRYDATNVVDPIVSVITSIGWDHMHILGDTLEAIACEKGGIIKREVPLVLGPFANEPI
ncbi:MAG: Mur ligase family protein, partial [Chlamydiota bacterium]